MNTLLIAVLVSQNMFAKTYGGTSWDYARSIIQTTDGGYVVAGEERSFGVGNYDFLVLKLDPSGDVVWARTFGGANEETLWPIALTSDGGYAVAGTTWSYGAGNSDFLVLKLDPSGNLIWARTFGGGNDEGSISIVQTSDGGYAIGGYTRSFGAGLTDFLVLKLNSSGIIEWAKTFGGAGEDYGVGSIIQTSDGGYAAVGTTMSYGAGARDFLFLKLNSSGIIEWAKTFGGGDNDEPGSIIQTSDGGYVVMGYGNNSGFGYADFDILKLNPSGDLEWARGFGGVNVDWPLSIIQTNDNGYAVTGFTLGFGAGGMDILTLKINVSGDLEWARTFGGTGDEGASSIIQTTDGAYTIAASTTSFGAGGYDGLILRLDQNGDYSDCVQTCSLGEMDISFNVSSVSLFVGGTCNPSTSDPNPTTTTPDLTITDACQPALYVEETPRGDGPRITCCPVPSGILFVSPGYIVLTIYAVDGRVAYTGHLQKGENRISLDQGVYLWEASVVEAGPRARPVYKGKAVVR